MELIKQNAVLNSHLQSIFKQDYDLYLQCFDDIAPSSIRLNAKKHALPESDVDLVKWCGTGLYLAHRPSYVLDPLYHAGAYYPQEAASMFLDYVIKYINQHYSINSVLDLSAAPGGKTLILSDNYNDDVLIVANEVIAKRSLILKENITRWGCSNVVVSQNDPGYFAKTNLLFDLILVDAPCSGEGMFRKDIDSIEQWSLDNVNLCVGRQKRILNDIVSCLAPGGILIYSTCTYNSLENEENIQWLKENYGLKNISIPVFEDWGIEKSVLNDVEAFRFYPHKTMGEGLFLSVLIKDNDSVVNSKVFAKPDSKLIKPVKASLFKEFLNIPELATVFNFKGSFYFANASLYKKIEVLVEELKIIHLPNEAGLLKGNDFFPAHALALSSNNLTYFDNMELSKEDAVSYLRKDSFTPSSSVPNWYRVTFNGLGLGWVKLIKGERVNNYLPEPLRIKKK